MDEQTKESLKNQLDVSIRAYELLLDKLVRQNVEDVKSVSFNGKKGITTYSNPNVYSLYFEIEYVFNDVEFVGDAGYYLTNIDKNSFKIFDTYKFSIGGKLVKRDIPAEETDDICCTLVNITLIDETLTVTTRMDFHVNNRN